MTRRRFLPRRPGRLLLLVLLALATLISPLAPGILPGPLDHLVTEAAAQDQSPSVIPGTPGDCAGDPDENNPSECVLTAPVCPESLIFDDEDEYMVLSDEYPNFCEESIAEADDAQRYNDCTRKSGVTVLLTGDPGNMVCRLVHPARCSAGMHRVSRTTCRVVTRRTWECNEEGSIPRNEFNTCYLEPPEYTEGTHPACGPGSPEFRVGTCDEFVGQDFLRDPSAPACGDFDTGSSPRMGSASNNDYWCTYNMSLLDVDCHRAGASCADSSALCVKRASRTGGCDSIANTIRCRSLQAAFVYESITAADVYRAGCEPCVIIPFQPIPADVCPANFLQSPEQDTSNIHTQIHRVKEDFRSSHGRCQSVREGRPMTPACSSLPTCADPPRGLLTWTSSHYSRVAVVNTPTILTVLDTPFETVAITQHVYGWRQRTDPLNAGSTFNYLLYPDNPPDDPFPVRLWPAISSSEQYGSVADMVDDGECVFRNQPTFRVIVEELWPDDDEQHAEIERLFGVNALDWWNDLSPELQEAHTLARGPRQQREVSCDSGADVWCRWTPTRSGYYRLKAAGAWTATQYGDRTWRDPENDLNDYFVSLLSYLGDPANRAELRAQLEGLERSPEDLGLTPGLDGLLPLPADTAIWAYGDPGTYRTACPAIDLRFFCAAGRGTANYTETEYIGIQVHELRVSTVAPSR